MKKIVTLLTFLIISQFSFAQTFSGTGLIIDSITVSPVLCFGDSTSATVHTNASGVAYMIYGYLILL